MPLVLCHWIDASGYVLQKLTDVTKHTPEGGPIDIDTGDVSAGCFIGGTVTFTYRPHDNWWYDYDYNNYYYLCQYLTTADQLGTHAAGIPLGLTIWICSSKTYLQ